MVKTLCMFEKKRVMMTPHMLDAIRGLGDVEVGRVDWDGPVDMDAAAVHRLLETDGPNVFDVPEDVAKYPDTEIAFTNWCPVSGGAIAALKKLRMVGIIRAGLDNIDVEAATKQGVLVVNAAGHNANAVSDFVVGLILAELRNIGRLHHNMKNRIFATPRDQSNIHELEYLTLGLIGFGPIARLVARKVSGFNMKVIAYDPWYPQEKADTFGLNVPMVDLDTLLTTADVVSMHMRLAPSTAKMIGDKQFDMMKKSAFFINAARSGMVDTDALIRALQEKKIAGAGLDVYDEEPLDPSSPLYDLDNVTLTPHRAGVSFESTSHSPHYCIKRMLGVIDGTSTECVVNPEVLEQPEFQAWREDVKKRLGR